MAAFDASSSSWIDDSIGGVPGAGAVAGVGVLSGAVAAGEDAAVAVGDGPEQANNTAAMRKPVRVNGFSMVTHFPGTHALSASCLGPESPICKITTRRLGRRTEICEIVSGQFGGWRHGAFERRLSGHCSGQTASDEAEGLGNRGKARGSEQGARPIRLGPYDRVCQRTGP